MRAALGRLAKRAQLALQGPPGGIIYGLMRGKSGCGNTTIACNLALGKGLAESVMLAKAYVSVAIARGQALGRGIGPVNHLYRLEELTSEKGRKE